MYVARVCARNVHITIKSTAQVHHKRNRQTLCGNSY